MLCNSKAKSKNCESIGILCNANKEYNNCSAIEEIRVEMPNLEESVDIENVAKEISLNLYNRYSQCKKKINRIPKNC